MGLRVAIRSAGVWWTPPATDVKFKLTAPGGCHSASFRLDRSPVLDLIASGDQVVISDGASSKALWQGRVSSPGRASERGVISLDVQVDGAAADLASSYRRRPYLSADLTVWERDDQQASATAADISTTTMESTTPWNALVLKVPEGSTVNRQTKVRARTRLFDGTGYSVGAVRLRHQEGTSTTYWQTGAVVGADTGSNRLYEAPAVSTAAGDATWAMDGTTTKPFDQELLTVFLEATSALTPNPFVTVKDTWSAFSVLATVAQLYKRDGSRRPNDSSTITLKAHEVIEDVLWRDLRGKITPDPNSTVIATSMDWALNSLDYRDMVSPRRVLDDLVSYSLDDYWWMVLPSDTSDGLPGLLWQPWGGTRYVMPMGATGELRGTDEGLCNRVRVFYTDFRGKKVGVTLTANPTDYPDTESMGYWDAGTGWARVVEAEPLDIGDQPMSAELATRIATGYLRTVASYPLGTQVQIDGPILDLYDGRMVQPWEVVPGARALIPESGRELRVTAVDCSETGATIDIATPRSTTDQLIARALRGNKKGRR